MQPACHARVGSKLGRISRGRPGRAAPFLQKGSDGQALIDAARGAMQERCPTGGGDSAAVHDHELDAIR